jgi:hypothetical protein
MSRLRALLVVAVVACLSLFGASMLSYAQKPGEELRAASPNQKLRDRLVTLQAEIETLRLERDAMRAPLLKALTDMEENDIMGIDLDSLGKQHTDFLARIDGKKKEFDRKVRALGEKELDLDEVKQRMAEVR